MDELTELWAIVIALPAQVWLDALYLFVLLGVLKAVGVVKADGQAQAANVVMAMFLNGGPMAIGDLSAMLAASGTAVVAAIYYLIWKKWLSGVVAGFVDGVKERLPGAK